LEKIFMKKTVILTTLAMFTGCGLLADEASSNNAAMTRQSPITSSQPRRIGAGIVVGQPTGPTVKYWLNDTMALDGTVGWSLRDDDNIYLNADVLWHNFDLLPVSRGRAAVYVGVGPSIEFRREEDNRVGVRAPVGISYTFENKPLDAFVEVAPILDVAPGLHGDFNVGIGVRYWF
jgi:hypothetical protein